jgi:hypothetical protein
MSSTHGFRLTIPQPFGGTYPDYLINMISIVDTVKIMYIDCQVTRVSYIMILPPFKFREVDYHTKVYSE